MSKPQFALWLEQRVETRSPAAVVRFGDGEARLFTANADEEAMDGAIHMLERETGLFLSPEAVLKLKRVVDLAFDEADVLGIAVGERFPAEQKMWMKKLTVLYAQRVSAGRPPVPLAHVLLGHHILDTLPKLLSGRRVSAISCRDVAPVLESKWGLHDVAVYQVPSQYRMRVVDGAFEAALHGIPIWPDAHARVHSELTIRESGEVFLVGAGMFGKDLCIRIRDEGGIALDMGSALDRIAGKITRGPRRRVLNLYARGMPVPEIASNLQRLYRTRIASETISQGLDTLLVDIDAWRRQPLEATYRAVRFEPLQVEIGSSGTSQSHICYLASGWARNRTRRPLGLWWQHTDDAEFWLRALGDLYRRGVRDLQITGAGELEGLDEATEAVLPSAGAPKAAVGKGHELCAPIRRAIQTHGPFRDEQTATKLIALSLAHAEGERRKVDATR